MPAPTHTHNKHTPSPVRPNHTAQREHINYRCTLNYFHYLPCSVDGTETGMMDVKGFAIPPQVVNAPSLTFTNLFPSLSFFILHQFLNIFVVLFPRSFLFPMQTFFVPSNDPSMNTQTSDPFFLLRQRLDQSGRVTLYNCAFCGRKVGTKCEAVRKN